MKDKDLVILNNFCLKLKKKPIYKVLKKIMRGTATEEESLKSLFSLGTHLMIELEQGNKKYLSLLNLVYKKIGLLLKRYN